MRLVTSGVPQLITESLVGTVTTEDLPQAQRVGKIRLFTEIEQASRENVIGFRAILSPHELYNLREFPRVERLRDWDHLRSGDVIVIEPKSGFVRSLFRPRERHHVLFVTERCNSNCLMCSQPPRDKDDVAELTDRNLRLIELMTPPPSYLTITGGEPTLLGPYLFTILHSLKDRLPHTQIHLLTNGRTFAWGDFTNRLAEVHHPNFSVGIPLYSDVAGDHDYIVQARGAFDQTMSGFHRLAQNEIRSEVRVVLSKLTIPRLVKLAEYIYRNLTFVEHIALMGLEQAGYTPRNIDELWIDPYDYREELEATVTYLRQREMTVSIYNHQLCVLPSSLWPYAQQSISDWKNVYIPECQTCSVAEQCGGFFKWNQKRRSNHIRPIV